MEAYMSFLFWVAEVMSTMNVAMSVDERLKRSFGS